MLDPNMQKIFRKYLSHKIVASRNVENFLTKIQEKRQSNLNIGKRLKQTLHQRSTYKDAHYHQWLGNCKLKLHRGTTGMSKISKTDDTKCWKGCEVEGTLKYC